MICTSKLIKNLKHTFNNEVFPLGDIYHVGTIFYLYRYLFIVIIKHNILLFFFLLRIKASTAGHYYYG